MPDPMPPSVGYRDAGLDLDIYEQTLAAIGPLLRRTHSPRVLDGFGGFAGLISLDPADLPGAKKYRRPVLIACTDGVGSKLKVAALANRHDTVGIDLVAMSVNDALCTGGEPLAFLDYIAMPKDDPALTAALVRGISEGCLEAGCSLVGGETAILPDFYAPGDYDMAGFCLGVVERDRIIDGKHIEPGDVVIGLPSSGLHSNGYSLVRKVVFDVAKLRVTDFVPELNKTVGDELLTPTRIYVKQIRQVLDHFSKRRKPAVRGLAHITGGGLVDNLPRVLPPGRRVVLRRGNWPVPAVFGWLQAHGRIASDEMDRVFNGGIGFVMVVAKRSANAAQEVLRDAGAESYVIGRVIDGEPGIDWD